MSNKLSVKNATIAFVLGLVLSASLLLVLSNYTSVKHLSSLTPQVTSMDLKNLSLKPKTNLLRRTSKLLPSFEVRIRNLTNDVVTENVAFELVGEIVGEIDANYFNYSWTIPDGIEVHGQTPLSGVMTVNDLRNNQLRLLLQQHRPAKLDSNEIGLPNLKVHLRIWPQMDGPPQTGSAQYNTTMQPEIDFQKRELANRNEAYLMEQKNNLER